MELERRTLKLGAAIVAGAVALRLVSGGVLDPVVQALSEPEAVSFLLYLETGRVVRVPQIQAATLPQETDPVQMTTQPEEQQDTPAVQAVFAPEDADLVSVNNVSGCSADLDALLLQPLTWDLTQEAPTVLILHTHTSESYTNTEGYPEASEYRTLEEAYNMVSIGDRVAEILEAGGVQVLHDRTVHDYPSYNGSYNHARNGIAEYLAQYPSICMVLDIHRDAMENSSGEQIGYTVELDGQAAAQLMLVVGTDAGGLVHPDWEENMALAVKLQAQLEKLYPGICRPISLRSQRFNQDLSAGAMLIEVGAAGNTRQEALLAAEALAQGVLALAHGAAVS